MPRKHPIYRWLRKADQTQKDLAEALGITPAYLADLLAWRRQPSLRVAVRLWRVTGIRPEKLAR